MSTFRLCFSFCSCFFVMLRPPPRSTRTDTLSLHDALPISTGVAAIWSTRPVAVALTAPAAVVPGGRRGGVLGPTCARGALRRALLVARSEEHTSELQSLMRISYAVFCLKKKHDTDYRQLTHRTTVIRTVPIQSTSAH